MYIFLLPLVIVTLLTLPVLSRIKRFSDGKKAQRAIIGNLCTFFWHHDPCSCTSYRRLRFR